MDCDSLHDLYRVALLNYTSIAYPQRHEQGHFSTVKRVGNLNPMQTNLQILWDFPGCYEHKSIASCRNGSHSVQHVTRNFTYFGFTVLYFLDLSAVYQWKAHQDLRNILKFSLWFLAKLIQKKIQIIFLVKLIYQPSNKQWVTVLASIGCSS